jgi:hypothetical protein
MKHRFCTKLREALGGFPIWLYTIREAADIRRCLFLNPKLIS